VASDNYYYHQYFQQDDYLAFTKLLDQDITYVASFDRTTFNESLIGLFTELKFLNWSRKPNKIQRKRELSRKVDNILRRLFYNQTVYDERNNKPIHPKQITRKIDRITTQGLARMSEIFAGESSGFYNFMVAGTSKVSAELGDWRLYEEKTVTSVLENGYSSGSGTIIKHGAAFSLNDPTENYYEFGVRDFPTFNEFQTLWFRSVLSEPVEHEQGKDIVIVGHAAYLVSVSDFEEQLNNNVI
jgi:hypothetical protein